LALGGAVVVHALLLGGFIAFRFGAPPDVPESIPVTLVFEAPVVEPAPPAPVAEAAPAPAAAIAPPAAETPQPPPAATAAAPPAPPSRPAPSPAAKAPPASSSKAPETAAAPAAPNPAPALAAPAAAAPDVAGRSLLSVPRSAEIAPPSPYLPYTPAQREVLGKSFFVGEPNYGTATSTEAINRSIVSKRAPPLTTAQRETLQKQLFTGENDAGGGAGKEKVVHDAALSKRAAPLTAEQWNALATVYQTGRALHQEAVANASIQHSALSLRIATADQQKALDAMYHPGTWSRGTAGLPSARSEARLLVQSEPELPAEFTDRAFSFDVTARLEVGSDGAVTSVILAQPTPEPYLNQALIVALQKWRYYPAVDAGKPVAATVEVHFTLSAPAIAPDKKGHDKLRPTAA
jgi:TonB family protein